MHEPSEGTVEVFALHGHTCAHSDPMPGWSDGISLIAGRARHLIGRYDGQQKKYSLIPCPSHPDL